MEKLKRYKIILKVAELESASDISKLIEGFIIDELRYAGLKARGDKDTLSKEIRCVLEAYSFDNYGLSSRIKNYIDYALANPFVATMQHYDLNDLVSYLGEYYDGTPTAKYRKKERYKIEPIKIEWHRGAGSYQIGITEWDAKKAIEMLNSNSDEDIVAIIRKLSTTKALKND